MLVVHLLSFFFLDKYKSAARQSAWYNDDDDGINLNPFQKIRVRKRFDEEYGGMVHAQSAPGHLLRRSSYSGIQPIQRTQTDRQKYDAVYSNHLAAIEDPTNEEGVKSLPGQIENELSARLSVTELDPSPQAQKGAAHHPPRVKVIISGQAQLRIIIPYGVLAGSMMMITDLLKIH